MSFVDATVDQQIIEACGLVTVVSAKDFAEDQRDSDWHDRLDAAEAHLARLRSDGRDVCDS